MIKTKLNKSDEEWVRKAQEKLDKAHAKDMALLLKEQEEDVAAVNEWFERNKQKILKKLKSGGE